MRLKITATALLLCFATNIFAQTSGEHCVAFKAKVDDSVGITLTEQQESALTSKINQILVRSNASAVSLYNGFVVTPQISIVSEETLTMGVRPVTTIISEVTLLASNSVDASNYGAITIEVKVSGNSQEDATTKIINAIRPTDPRITKFVNSAIKRINDYYTMNMPTVIRKVETLIAGEKYEDAMIFLESIPTCVPAYEQSSEAIQALYKMLAGRGFMATKSSAPIAGEGEMRGESAPANASASANISPFETFVVNVLSCKGDVGTNVVTIELLIKNVTDLSQKFSLSHTNSLMYNNDGDEFQPRYFNSSLDLRADMSRKVSFSFERVPAKNSVINATVQCHDGVARKGGVIDIKDIPVAW